MPPSKEIFFSTFNVTSQVFHTTPLTASLVNLRPLLPGHTLIVPILPPSLHPPTSSSTSTSTSTSAPTSPLPPTFSRLTHLPPAHLIDLFATAQTVARMLERVYGAKGINWGVQDGVAAGQSVAHVHLHLIPRGGRGEMDVARERREGVKKEVEVEGGKGEGGAEVKKEVAGGKGEGEIKEGAGGKGEGEIKEGAGGKGEGDGEADGKVREEEGEGEEEEGVGDQIYEMLESWDGNANPHGQAGARDDGESEEKGFPKIEEDKRVDRSKAEMEAEAAWLAGEMVVQERLEREGGMGEKL